LKRYLRLDGGFLSTPVREFVHPGSGRRVTVIASMHVGERRYYDEIRAILDQHAAEGAVILVEGSIPPTDEERAAATDAERLALEAFERFAEVSAGAVDLFNGWVYQTDAFPKPADGEAREQWRSADLPTLDIIRAGGPETIRRRFDAQIRMLLQRPQLVRFMIGAGIRLQARMSLYEPAAAPKQRRQRGDAVVTQRSQVALDAALAEAGDVVIWYGPRHMADFHRGLARAGFGPDGERWLTVGMLPKLRTMAIGAARKRKPDKVPA
jgi:hypothetical protein